MIIQTMQRGVETAADHQCDNQFSVTGNDVDPKVTACMHEKYTSCLCGYTFISHNTLKSKTNFEVILALMFHFVTLTVSM